MVNKAIKIGIQLKNYHEVLLELNFLWSFYEKVYPTNKVMEKKDD